MSFFGSIAAQKSAPLRYDIFDDRGVLLLRKGTHLTPSIASTLDRRGIQLRLRIVLRVIRGGSVGVEIPIPEAATVTVGRDESCTLRPGCRLVSSHHCEFSARGGGLTVEDSRSTNGTFVNDQPIHRPTELANSDVVSFGNMAVQVELWATLEGAEVEVQSVAGMILAETSDAEQSLSGKTLEMKRDSADLERLRKAWDQKFGDKARP